MWWRIGRWLAKDPYMDCWVKTFNRGDREFHHISLSVTLVAIRQLWCRNTLIREKKNPKNKLRLEHLPNRSQDYASGANDCRILMSDNLQPSLSLRDSLQCVKECNTCSVTTSQSAGTGAIRMPPLLGEGHGLRWQVNHRSEARGSQGGQLAGAIRWFLSLPWPSLLFCNSSVKDFTGVDEHEMNFPEKFLKRGKVHGSKVPVGNETILWASVFLYKESFFRFYDLNLQLELHPQLSELTYSLTLVL